MSDYLGSVALPSMKMRQRKLCQIRQRPRAAPVYKDSSNIGVRMLEKLGWSEGKGLGKREDGMSAPILPKMKQDAEGFGYAGEKDDHWTQHDQDFNQLLKSLNGEETPAVDEVDLVKMQSLEEKSKNSRARVHYKKFTRGKDLSRASEKDLANIFGKKTMDEVKNQMVVAEIEVENDQDDGQDSDETNVMGLTTIKASMSVQDYFKSKMQEKLDLAKANPVIEQKTVVDLEEASSAKKSKKSKRSIDLDETVADPFSEEVGNGEEISKKKKKKKKRSKDEESGAVQEPDLANGNVEEEPAQEQPPKKKSKKEKRSKVDHEELCAIESNKKKSKKDKSQQLEDDQPLEVEDPPAEQPVKKKSKKNKRKLSDEEVDSTSQPEQQTEEIQTSSEEVLAEASVGAGEARKKITEIGEEDEITCRVKVSVLKELDESGFPGSNFADIVGYGLSQNVKLIKKESHRKRNLEKHQFIRQKQTSFQRKRQMLKKVSAFKRI